MKIEITIIDGPNPCMWHLWRGGRCLASGTEKTLACARTRAQAAMKEAKRKQVVRWPRKTTSR